MAKKPARRVATKAKAPAPKLKPAALPKMAAATAPVSVGVSRDVQAMMAFESNKKSATTAFLLWFFLGMFGGHRFYFGQTGTAILMILLTISIIGTIPALIWCIVDAFSIPSKVRDFNNRLAQSLGQSGFTILPTK